MDAVDPDPVLRIVRGKHADQAVDAGLARGVGVESGGDPVEAGGRAGADDRTAPTVEQRPRAMLGGEEGTGQVGSQRPLPDVEVEPVGAVVLADELRLPHSARRRPGRRTRRRPRRRLPRRLPRRHVTAQTRVRRRPVRHSDRAPRHGPPPLRKRSAVARPMPLQPPVTSARLSCRRPTRGVWSAGVRGMRSTLGRGALRRQIGFLGTISLSVGVMAPTLAMSLTGVQASA